MIKVFLRSILFLFLLLAPVRHLSALTVTPVVSDSGVLLSDPQWNEVRLRFENEIFSIIDWLKNYKTKKESLGDEIDILQKKSLALRQEIHDESNVFKEIRLKGLLNDLKDKLEENSDLEKQADEKQKEFEQKCLSLIELYNNRIQQALETPDSAPLTLTLDAKLDNLTTLVRKRTRIQTLLKQYQKKERFEKSISLASIRSLNSNDSETLQLTLDLFKDRKKDIEEKLEKWSLEETEVKSELKLQSEMQDFLEDIQRMNADSSFPQGNLKKNDLSAIMGGDQKNRLNLRLNEINEKVVKGQKTLIQMNQLMDKVQNQLDVVSERKHP